MFSAGFRKYFSNTSWLFIERIVGSSLTAIVSIYVARYLGPDRFGLLNYSISFVALFSALAAFGIDTILARELLEKEKPKEVVLGTAFLIQISTSFLAFILIFFSNSRFVQDDIARLLILIISISIFIHPALVVQAYFQSIVQSKYIVIVKLCVAIVSATLKILLIIFELNLIWFALAIAFDSLILVFGLIIVSVYKKLNIVNWSFNAAIAKKLFHSAWPLMLSGIMVTLYMRIDQVMIKHFINDNAVGQYSVAVRITEFFYFIPIIVCNSLFPAIANSKNNNRKEYEERLIRLLSLMFYTSLFIAVLGSFFSSEIINILFGISYSEASSVLEIQMWCCVFVFLGVVSTQYLVVEKLEKLSFIRTMGGCLINIVLNMILIPKYSITGAAWATLISYICANYLIGLTKNGRPIIIMMFKSVYKLKIITNKA